MRIDKVTWRMGRDFTADLVCEHCDRGQELTTGYDDTNYHDNVIPAIACEGCGLDRSGASSEATAMTPAPGRWVGEAS